VVSAVSFSLSSAEFSAISTDRSLQLPSKVNDYGGWIGIDYLILCTDHHPTWVAKIEDIVISRLDGGPMTFRFSEVRSVFSMTPSRITAFEPFRFNQYNPKITVFADNSFFTVGDVVPFIAKPDTLGPLSMDRAIHELSQTYGVSPDQVDITIRSRAKPAAADI
jgi:hypothetical protein